MLERPRGFGTLATLTADGSPHQAVIWYGLQGDSILVKLRDRSPLAHQPDA